MSREHRRQPDPATSKPAVPRFTALLCPRSESPEGTFVRYDGEDRPPATGGPFAETKDLIAGWMVIDVDNYDRTVELAGHLSAAPGAGGRPLRECIEVCPFLGSPIAITA